MEIFPRDIVWRAGGKSLLRYGTLTAKRQIGSRGGEDAKETFVRADAATCAMGWSRDGVLRTHAANTPRLEWLDTNGDGLLDTPAWSLEGARTNAFTKSQALDDAAWTKTRSSCSGGSINAIQAPDGTVTADKLVEDNTASATHIANRNTPTLTDNTRFAFSVWAKAAERTWIQLLPTNKAGTVLGAYFNLSTGVLGTVDSGVVATIHGGVVPGWYRCGMTLSAGSGATTPFVRAGLATGNGGGTYSGDGASGAYLWGFQFETDQPLVSSYIATDASAVTRAAEYATWPLSLYPGQVMTLYLKTYLRSLDTTADRVLCQLGATDTSTANLVVKLSSGNIVATYTTAAGSSTGTLALGSPTLPVTAEFRVTLATTGAVTLGYATAGGAESTNTGSTLTPTAWATPKIMVGGRTTTLGAFMGLIDGFLIRGTASMTDCRAVI